jgi:hypothetical protein
LPHEDGCHRFSLSTGADLYGLWTEWISQLHPLTAPAESARDSVVFSVSESHFAAFFFAIQLFGELLLLSGYFVPLALTLLAAELYNILAFHLTLASASVALALVWPPCYGC